MPHPEVDYKECIDGVCDGMRDGVRDGMRDGVRNGMRSPEFVGIWSAWVNLLTSTECRGPFADVEIVHGQKKQYRWVPRRPGPCG
jgi:hypothetical protein